MNDQQLERFESRLRAAASSFPYPPTQDVAANVRRRLAGKRAPIMRRRLAWAAVAFVLAVAALLSVPEVRAAIVEFLQIGVVRIFLVAPTTTPVPTPEATVELVFEVPVTATPLAASTLLPSLLDLDGETTLDDARTRAGFSIPLPAYPSDLGSPDHVYLQDVGGSFVVLVWIDPQQPDRVRLSLHLIGPGSFAAEKYQPTVIAQTTVNGQPAVWAEGPYILRVRNGYIDERRLIEGHVLIWKEGDITYRLETDLSLEEAVKIAESLKTCPATQPITDEPPDDPNADPFGPGPWFINEDRTVWAGPYAEEYPWKAGADGNKILWIRPEGTELKVSGHRLDADAPPLRAEIPCCYPTGFQVTGLYFSTEGCWEVTAEAGKSRLQFVVEIAPEESQ